MKKKFKKEIQSLDAVFRFNHKFIASCKLKKLMTFKMNLLIEEIFTNLVKYNKKSSNDVLINLCLKKENIWVSITDFDVNSFNVTKTKQPDISKSLQERKVGGLGLHLVKNIADKVEYKYINGNSVITLMIKPEK